MRILYVGHTFFGYYKLIISEIRKQFNAEVDFYNIKPTSIIYRTIKFDKVLHKKFLENYFNKILEPTKRKKYNYVLVIGSTEIHLPLIKKLRELHEESVFLMYQWDAIKTNGYQMQIKYFDKVFSFDRVDCNNNELNYLPLFYINEYKIKSNPNPKIDLLFIGSADIERASIINKIKIDADKKGKNFYYYMFITKLMYYRMKIVDQNFNSTVKRKDVYFTKIDHSKISKLMFQSKAVLDIERFGQSGLTMRTFETIGARRKLVTTNNNVIFEDFYDEKYIQVLNRENININWEMLDNNIIIDKKTAERYSLSKWVETLFE